MLNIRPLTVNPMLHETLIISAAVGACALLAYATGLDAALARLLYTPTSPWAAFLREYGALSTGIGAWLCLLGLLLPRAATRWPSVYKAMAVVVLTAVLGAGLLNQIVVKDLAQRPRPRDGVLAEQVAPQTELHGKSMPSGHAGMAYVLAAPYFALRTRKPKAAKGFLLVGLVWGSVVGVARMVAGAHFLSDVLVAALITLATARVAAGVMDNAPPIPRKALLAGMVLIGALFVLGNKFTVDVTYMATTPWHSLNLPCTLQGRPEAGITTPTLQVRVTGYGAPTSQLRLRDDNGVLQLETRYGLYHSLACTGEVVLPMAVE
ncbi:MAG: phosphatase PAP2 family protein [Alphaproteobacteria bacterium]